MKALLKKIWLKTPIGKKYLKYSTFWEPGHYYSAIPDNATGLTVSKKLLKTQSAINGINLNDKLQLALFESLRPLMASSVFRNKDKEPSHRFFNQNGIYGFSDALILEAMIRHLKPTRIIEAGSGFSSALMMDVNEKYFGGAIKLEFIEPYPDRLFTLLTEEDKKNVTLRIEGIQTVDLNVFSSLQNNDILFIDSSHVAKTGSDLLYLFFEVLPCLNKGVYIHFHDIFNNFEYLPDHFATTKGFGWNENYFLRSFLMYNSQFEVVLFSNYLDNKYKDRILSLMADYPLFTGAQIWLRRI